jgi:hypothetical protein
LWLLAVATIVSNLAQAASQIDGTWTGYNNGFPGSLVLKVHNDGTVEGTGFDGEKIQGFFNETTNKLVFYRIINPDNNEPGKMNPDNIQIFTGYLAKNVYTVYSLSCPPVLPTSKKMQALAGTFESFSGTGATQHKNVFGWSVTKQLE